MKYAEENKEYDYQVVTGKVIDVYTDKILIVSIVTLNIPQEVQVQGVIFFHQYIFVRHMFIEFLVIFLQVPAVDIFKMNIYTSIEYKRIRKTEYASRIVENENKAISVLFFFLRTVYLKCNYREFTYLLP